MGLITGLLTLPLAPVRGTVWLAQVIQQHAETQLYDEPAIMSALAELESAREQGIYSDEEIEEAEDALLQRLIELRTVAPESYG
jgi:gas vesicle protein GvpG